MMLTRFLSLFTQTNDINKVNRGAKILERMVNQNLSDDIAHGVCSSPALPLVLVPVAAEANKLKFQFSFIVKCIICKACQGDENTFLSATAVQRQQQ